MSMDYPAYSQWQIEGEPSSPHLTRLVSATLFGTACLWGLATGFSYWTGLGALAQGGGLVAAALLFLLAGLVWPATWLSYAGLLMTAHAVAALLSAVLNGPTWFVVRYVLLLPALLLMLSVVRVGEKAIRCVQAGLTLAVVVFAVYHLAFVDVSALTTASYRLDSFLNPNSIGYIAALGGISLIDFVIRRWPQPRERWSPTTLCIAGALAACFVLCLATKSRTATIVLIFGVTVRLYLALGMARVFILSVVGLISIAIAWEAVASFSTNVATTYQLFDRTRGLSGGTGRFQIWQVVVERIWLPNVLFGVGPGNHMEVTHFYTGVRSVHNGLLQNLAEVGLIGAAPLVLLLVHCFKSAHRQRRDGRIHFAIALLAGGCLASVPEEMFFSIGNPGSLLFLLSVAVLAGQPLETASPQPAVLEPNPTWTNTDAG